MDTNRQPPQFGAAQTVRSGAGQPAQAFSPTVTTLVWMNEFDRIERLYHDAANQAPRFRTPDLISACVTLVFSDEGAADKVFRHIHTCLLLQDLNTPRHAAAIWRPQYELLLALQRSSRNRHPNPHFNLDHFTTACVHLALAHENAKCQVFAHARQNTARRAGPIT
ncbi:hypothetical protein RugamoR57_49060 [Duganella caerulea]|uniref:hypothetical protein n=1 Tax=Duganella caerulea TaxID=2885762 RepID=UPI0030EA4C54